LLIDWTNFLVANPVWEWHQGATREDEETTEFLFKTNSQLEKEGKHPPKLVLMMLFNAEMPGEVVFLSGGIDCRGGG
jgi:hypothetical protein